MELLAHIRKVCAERGTTIAKVEKAIGFNKVIYNWDKYTPSVDKVAAVADFFGISIDELIGRSAPALSAVDRQILDLVHQLNEDGQGAALAMLQGLAQQPGYIKSDPTGEMEA